VAKPLHETDILRAAAAFEVAHPWADKRQKAVSQQERVATKEPLQAET
jgi:hypothetical protein